MSELPKGTVTFAFTDIEGSTSLLKQLGDGYAALLADHRQLMRKAFAEHGGVEIDTQGDAFFYAFARAREAVAAAAEVQRVHAEHAWPAGAAVRVRIGLHTGEPTLAEEGYVGLDVVRAARLCATCQGGQVLLSQSTRALIGSSLPQGVHLFPLGERHLKDIDEPEVVYELEIDGVPIAAPTSQTAGAQTPEAPAAPQPAMPAAPLASPAGVPAAGATKPGRGLDRRIEEWAARMEAEIEGRIESGFSEALGSIHDDRERRKAPGALDEMLARASTLSHEIIDRVRRELADAGGAAGQGPNTPTHE